MTCVCPEARDFVLGFGLRDGEEVNYSGKAFSSELFPHSSLVNKSPPSSSVCWKQTLDFVSQAEITHRSAGQKNG
ncbi:hypothetical protein NQZ68_030997 [Dissostichus eleginoides]|nr:hypothetical protein NQZ68_030997 [Dissostichus eleginoides]